MTDYPTQLDEIDQWLADNFGILPGACSSTENLRYNTARMIAEALWPDKDHIADDSKMVCEDIEKAAGKPILDACCGGKMFYFDKNDPRVLFQDIRSFKDKNIYNGRTFSVEPDVVADFTSMPYPDESFNMVVFDPPHLKYTAEKEIKGWQVEKYGWLPRGRWREIIEKGFSECFRVLRPGGFLIFKWNETDIKVSEVLALTDQKPVFGHISGKRANTHWICFMKTRNERDSSIAEALWPKCKDTSQDATRSEKELTEAAEAYASNYPAYNDEQVIAKYAFKRGAEWQKEQDHYACRQCEKDYDNVFFKGERHAIKMMEKENKETIELAEDHALLAGRMQMREEMLKDAIDATVYEDAGGYPFVPAIEMYDYDKDEPTAKKGDKVKVYIFKN